MRAYDRPLIVEFNGLPGSGKTTVSNKLFELLKSNDFYVERLSTIIEKFSESGKYKKYIKLFSYGGVRFSVNLLFFYLSIKPFKMHRLHSIKQIYLYYLVYQKCIKKSEYDVVVADQGIIQAAISGMHLDKLENKKYLKKILSILSENKCNYLIVDCLLDVKISSDRITGRNFQQGRFDKMQRKLLLKNLDIQKNTFVSVRDCLTHFDVNQISLDIQKNVIENSNILYNRINSIIRGHTTLS